MTMGKFGEKVRSKTEVAQINEILAKIVCHNICVVIRPMYELGISPTLSLDSTLDAKVAQS